MMCRGRSREERLVRSLADSLLEQLILRSSSPSSSAAAAAAGNEEGDAKRDTGGPPGDGGDGARIQRWIREMARHVRRVRGTVARESDSAGPREGEEEEVKVEEEEAMIVQKAIELAIRRWKDNEPSSFPNVRNRTAPKERQQQQSQKQAISVSFSLFDQLGGGLGSGGGNAFASALDSMVTWDHIQAAKSSSEVLRLLQKVQHIDDIAPDWDRINPVLRRGLFAGHSVPVPGATATDDHGANRGEKDPDPGPDGDSDGARSAYLELHDEWFDRARPRSFEHHFVQTDLMRNILFVLERRMYRSQTQTHDGDDASSLLREDDWTVRLAASFCRMWMDCMLRGDSAYIDNPQIQSIGTNLWNLIMMKQGTPAVAGSAPSISRTRSSPAAYFPSKVALSLMRVDPNARCLAAWFAHLKPSRILDVSLPRNAPAPATRKTFVAGAAPEGIAVGDNATTATTTSSSSSSHSMSLYLNYCQDYMLDDEIREEVRTPKDRMICRYALSLLYTILEHVRIGLFPFEQWVVPSVVRSSDHDDGTSMPVVSDGTTPPPPTTSAACSTASSSSTRVQQGIRLLVQLYNQMATDAKRSLAAAEVVTAAPEHRRNEQRQAQIDLRIASQAKTILLDGRRRTNGVGDGDDDDDDDGRLRRLMQDVLETASYSPDDTVRI